MAPTVEIVNVAALEAARHERRREYHYHYDQRPDVKARNTAAARERMRERRKNPEFREREAAYRNRPDVKARTAAYNRAYYLRRKQQENPPPADNIGNT
jgi:hypothetical protein